jgi:predicted glutamine amidotransferase
MIADSLPEAVVLDHLINLPNSLKHLGAFNVNGWGLAYYNDTEPTVLRGKPPASTDPNFDLAAQEMAGSGAHIGVGHVRAASSGATAIPDPHPFIRYKDGKWWAFGHNGDLSKTTLKNLIGPDYLAQNPPTVGDNWSDPNVIDSDLYMLYILKCTQENGWNATLGMAKAVKDISALDYGGMNFFFTDGETLWGFRRGPTLYYYYNATSPQYSAIASQPPTASQDGWIALYDYNLITLTRNDPPQIIDDITAILPQPQTHSLTITTTAGGTTYPAPRTYTYPANSTVQVVAIPQANYLLDHWELDGVNVGSANPYVVLIDRDHALKAVFSPIPPPLSLSISPLSASILMGQSVTFTSVVSGGYTPYSYQWYLDGNPVSGANSSSWIVALTTARIYCVFFRVTDFRGNIAQSDTARITVTPVPLGGYSIRIEEYATIKPLIAYLGLVLILVVSFITVKCRTSSRTNQSPPNNNTLI